MGEPAFPTTPVNNGYGPETHGNGTGSGPGMELRDYFAIRLMTALMTRWKRPYYDHDDDDAVKEAYRLADAMLTARDPKGATE